MWGELRPATYRPASRLHCRLAQDIGRIVATRMVYCTPPRHLSVGELAASSLGNNYRHSPTVC